MPAAIGTGIGDGAEFHFHPRDEVRDRTALGFVLLLDVGQLHPRRHPGGGDLAGLQGELQLLGHFRLIHFGKPGQGFLHAILQQQVIRDCQLFFGSQFGLVGQQIEQFLVLH